MNTLIALLNPRRQNQIQRFGLFAAIFLILLVFILHNPTLGYQQSDVCPAGMPSYLCSTRELGFLELRSYGALVETMNPIGTVLLIMVAILTALIAWLIIFKTEEQ